MTGPPLLYLIRHGETAWSLSGQHTGRSEVPLTAKGEAMAQELSTRLQDLRFAQVLTSPRLRARETCRLAGLAARAEVEPQLAEWDYGDYEGLRSTQIHALRPDWDIWTDGCPGGETAPAVSARADRLIAQLCMLHGNIALFSHGHFGRVLAARWLGLAACEGRHFSIDPCSVGVLGVADEAPHPRLILLWNASSGVLRRGP